MEDYKCPFSFKYDALVINNTLDISDIEKDMSFQVLMCKDKTELCELHQSNLQNNFYDNHSRLDDSFRKVFDHPFYN